MHTPLEAVFRISLSPTITVLTVSESINSLLGFNADDFLSGKITLQSRIHEHDQDVADELFSKENDKKSNSFNLRLRHADGRIRCIKGLYNKDVFQGVVTVDLLLQDAKSLWQVSEDQSSQQSTMVNFKAMMDNTDDYIYFKDRNHVFNGASQALVEITESVKHWTEFLGVTDYDVFLEEYADIYYELEKQVFSGTNVAYDIQETLLQDGSKGWINNRKYPIKNDDGEIVGLFGIARDITESKMAEQALRESEASLKESQIIAGIGSYVFNIQAGTWESTDILDQILGIDKEYDRSEKGWDALIHPADLHKAKNYLRRRFATKSTTYDREYRIIRQSDKVERYLRGIGRLVLDSQGRPLRMHGTIQDVTDKRQELIAEKRAILGNRLIGIITVINRKVMWANAAFENMLGYGPGELAGVSTRQLYANIAGYKSIQALYPKIENDEIAHSLQEFVRKDGQKIWVNMSATLLHSESKESLWAFADVTDRKKIENDLRIAATAFESQEGMLVTDANNIILRVNNSFTNITGYSAEDVIGKSPNLLGSGKQDRLFYADMWKSINDTGTWAGEIWNRRKSGEIYPEHLTITAVKDVNGVVTNYVATLTDITSSKAASEAIKNLAFYDPLTQLPNRRLLIDRLKQALASSTRSKQRGALLFIDLDHFKNLNDSLGHDIGDLLLQQVAERLTNCVREGDTVARLGGDEFVVLLEDLSAQKTEVAAQAEVIAHKILSVLNEPYQLGVHEYHNSSSIGLALFNDHEADLEELLKQADIAMYDAKNSGRNMVRFFDPKMQELINQRTEMERDLRNALVRKEFQLYYQVQVDAQGNALGAEALIRWHHPESGLISPFHFIPLAEETGLILPIGLWVLDTACAQLKAWEQDQLTRELDISINVSAKQFKSQDFVKQVQATIQRHAINPNHLKLELTESMLVDDLYSVIINMVALQVIGVRFELDDFGTGYSSLQYLKQLPLYQLKIDQSFVRDIDSDESDRALIYTIITMAQSLNLQVIAEGVETDDQRQFLFENGCLHYQGYLFSKPVPVDEFEALLRKK